MFVTITLNLTQRQIIVEDARCNRTRLRTGVKPVAMLKLLTHLAYCGRYARIHSSDESQTYSFAPVLLYRNGRMVK